MDLEKQIGLKLFKGTRSLNYPIRVIEFRNLIVRNGGIINRTFKRKLPGHHGKIGEPIDVINPVEVARSLAHFVVDIDSRARQKFRLTSYGGGHVHRRCDWLGTRTSQERRADAGPVEG